MKTSIIIPVLNDADKLRAQLESLQKARQLGHQVIVVDGGSKDGTAQEVNQGLVDVFLETARGRARQMNHGASAADGDLMLFLHADTRLPDQAMDLLDKAMREPRRCWGRFDIRLSGSATAFRVIESAMNLRSHLTGVVTGDQGLFVRRQTFRDIGGFPDIPLMEDVAISKLLRATSWPVRIKVAATTSSRRWEEHGVLSTMLLMWSLRLQYFLGVAPESLVRKYYPNH